MTTAVAVRNYHYWAKVREPREVASWGGADFRNRLSRSPFGTLKVRASGFR
jgi:hypothetical protein